MYKTYTFITLIMTLFLFLILPSCGGDDSETDEAAEEENIHYPATFMYEKWDDENNEGKYQLNSDDLTSWEVNSYFIVQYDKHGTKIQVERWYRENPNADFVPNGWWKYYDSEGVLYRLEYWDKGELKQVKSYMD